MRKRRYHRPTPLVASTMTDTAVATELKKLGAEWDRVSEDDVGHGGSPGEGLVERMGELEQEQRRRRECKPAPRAHMPPPRSPYSHAPDCDERPCDCGAKPRETPKAWARRLTDDQLMAELRSLLGHYKHNVAVAEVERRLKGRRKPRGRR